MHTRLVFTVAFLIGTVFSAPLASPSEFGGLSEKRISMSIHIHILDMTTDEIFLAFEELKRQAHTGVVLSSKRSSRFQTPKAPMRLANWCLPPPP